VLYCEMDGTEMCKEFFKRLNKFFSGNLRIYLIFIFRV
jgi:hypothetical protein